MAKFTRKLRQEIVREFATRHNGTFNPALFVEEVRRVGAGHPAFDWFEWDQDKAATSYQIEQAREFARDLRVSFTVEEIGRSQNVRVREMPMVLSPMSGRKDGGGYYLVDPANGEHMAEHCQQAAIGLRAWLNRYEAALVHAHGSPAMLRQTVEKLEAAASKGAKAA